MNAHSMIAPVAHAFNPREWLARFEELGGGYTMNPDGELIIGCIVAGRSEEDQRRAHAMLAALTSTQKKALRDLLRPEPVIRTRPHNPDRAIVDAWNVVGVTDRRLRQAFAEHGHQLPDSLEIELTTTMDAAEHTIHDVPATTLAGVEAKLWLALTHMADAGDQLAAVFRSDLAALDSPDTDWHLSLIVSAIKSIRAMQQAAQDPRAIDEITTESYSGSDAVSEYLAAYNAHNDGQTTEDDYIEAVWKLDDWCPATPRDFTRKFVALYRDGGQPSFERTRKLLEQAKHLVGEA
ncbi:hypothetical protein [Novosphingobium olei]|uniref:Uncharacterized protein n=1 Tax=Novosphingobium olei TaxID=2728851 RepID=A0A7Y0BS79_9SPHN|nr:hypothetical protein [Novosphingobium olei]NML95458.1 hypothetical protein [Novosphingobium olei]